MKYLSVCSGIEAATVAWHGLGWTPVAFSEIESFPCAVLAHHYPSVPNYGDMTKHEAWPIQPGGVDLIVGGTPCQSFSVAGLRKGLADPRGNLALTYLAMVDRLRPRWIVWENVPGVLSSSGGRDFGAFLGGLAELGYGWAYRVLDAQHFGVPQRRRRVFLVGHSGGDWQRAAAVLFEPESLRGDTPPGRAAREGATASTVPSLTASGRGTSRTGESRGQDPVIPVAANTMTRRMGKGINTTCDEGQTLIPTTQYGPMAFETRIARNGRGAPSDIVPPLKAQSGETGKGDSAPMLAGAFGVRRLLPVECEKLQGFPPGYTLVPYRGKPASDGPRYKALGNSMAVPCMRWIGERIAMMDAIQQSPGA